MIKSIFLLLIVSCCHSLFMKAQEELRFASVFTDHLVLQQKSRVKVWGYAPAKTQIRLANSWHGKIQTAAADSMGRWMVELETPAASVDAYRLTLSDGERTVTLNDVLVGEVWLCSGQSNMEMMMRNDVQWNLFVDNANKEMAVADYPAIRFIKIQRDESFTPLSEAGSDGWKVCTPQTVGTLSAVGYYFARKLLSELNVPVGLVVDAYGGSPIQSWIPETHSTSSLYAPERRTVNDTRQKGVLKPEYNMLSALYHAMLHPVVGYGIRGWLWYQGESNVGDAERYLPMMEDLVGSWRSLWNANLPFYYVQIAPFQYPGYQSEKWAELADVQSKALLSIPRTGMAVTADLGDSINIHPGKKKQVGERLALIALAKTYHKRVKCESPVLTKLSVDRGALKAEFRFAYKGLRMEGKHHEFEISADGETYYKPAIRIKGNCVWLHSPQVPTPRYVRYGWRDACVSTLYNSERLPLGPFQASVRL